jgi:YjbE family integral membrane protein
LGSIAQYLNQAQWAGAGAAFWIAVPQIVLVNVLLSTDTAVVIAMACRGLPPRQRSWGMAIGAGTAALLLIAFALIVAPLLAFRYVKLIGGLALVYIAIKLLVSGEPTDRVEAAASWRRVVRIVAVADIVLSLDNIIAVAAIARGNLALLVIGLAVSIPIVLAGAALISALLDRFPILVWAGAALLGWIAGDIIATDPAVADYVIAAFGETAARQMALPAAAAGAIFVLLAAALLRRRARKSA